MATERVTPQELIDQFRDEVDDIILAADEVDGLLWSQASVLRYLNQAQYELAEMVGWIRGEVQAVVVADYAEVALPSRVVDVFSVYSENSQRDLTIKDRREITQAINYDYGVPRAAGNWRDRTGSPTEVYLDMEMDKMFLVPTPVEDDTLLIRATLLPQQVTPENVSSCRLAFRRPDYCWKLLPYMKYLAYGKHDSDTYNPQLSSKYKAQADQCFEEIYSSVQRARRSNRPNSGTTGYGGIPL